MRWFPKVMLVVILAFLITISIVEEKIVSSALVGVAESCYAIEEKIEGKEDIREVDIYFLVENLEYDWLKNEEKLCYLANHRSMQELGMEIARLKIYIAENDVKEFKASLEVVKFYSKSYLHFMGANLHNVI